MANKILFDTHAHLEGEEYDADREEMIARARSAGVGSYCQRGL